MPFRRRFRKRNFRRRHGRRRGRGLYKGKATKLMLRIPNAMKLPLPDRMKTKMTLAVIGSLISIAAEHQYLLFFGGNLLATPFINNIGTNYANFIPFGSTGGTQSLLKPQYFQQLIGLSNYYQEWRVYANKTSVTCTPANISDTAELTMLPVITPNFASNTADPSSLKAMPYSKSRMVTVFNDVSKNTVSIYNTTSQVYGVTNTAVQSEDDFRGLTVGQPVNTWVWLFSLANSTSSSFSGKFSVDILITYYVELGVKNTNVPE